MMTSLFAIPTEWWLDISAHQRTQSQQQSQRQATPGSRWTAYLNQLSLDVILAWLQENYTHEAQAWLSSADRATIWEFVNGAAITLGDKRILLMPSEVTDDAELEVPQEWVDLPDWVADYYLAVQVQLEGEQPDEAWVRVWGYTTHHALKTDGRYDASDRTYCLDAEHLTRDLTTFWVTFQCCATETTRAAVAPLAELPATQAESLIQRLSAAAIGFPRLSVPFTLWGSLLQQPAYRQRLFQQRQSALGEPRLSQTLTHLSQWFQNRLESGWQTIDALLMAEPTLAYNLRSTSVSTEVRGKQLHLEAPPDHPTVLMFIGLTPEDDERVGIRVQVHPTSSSPFVPANLTLALLSDAGETLQAVRATPEDNFIQLRKFRCPLGTRFCLQIALDQYEIIEEFLV